MSSEQQQGRPHFSSRATVPAHAPGARLIGAGGRSKRGGCRCLARSPAGCRGRRRQKLQTNPPKKETLGCPCRSRPGLKGSVQYEKESLLCASAAMFFSDGCWEMGLASRPSIDRSSSERLVYCMLQPPCVMELMETRSSGRFVWCD